MSPNNSIADEAKRILGIGEISFPVDVSQSKIDEILSWKPKRKGYSNFNIILIYSYICHYDKSATTLSEIAVSLDICNDTVSIGLRELESHKWIQINRKVKPYSYKVLV